MTSNQSMVLSGVLFRYIMFTLKFLGTEISKFKLNLIFQDYPKNDN